jgi:AraC-like DNA-binding protein/mannose-6-phosphate isomerase-like protein (cupin superfamily)
MKIPLLKKIDTGLSKDSFKFLYVNDSFFFPSWHYHPEYEIMYLLKGRGTFYIGDCNNTINEGQIFFLGPNIPHLFRNYAEYFDKGSKRKVKAIVIYIREEFMKSDLFDMKEFCAIKVLLNQSKRGLVIRESQARKVGSILRNVTKKKGADSIIEFLSMLNLISNETEYSVLTSIGYMSGLDTQKVTGFTRVFDYLLKNFSSDITLKEIADLSNMSVTTFCRYFKRMTNTTLISFLNEIRIGHACKLMIENKNKKISQICYESGFRNLTNFYIQFHKIKKTSPIVFKNSYNF